ncbi:hypothetical protein EVAR_60607_1 [Eumeta japonica]|uniref:Uncharacterized protein n=1 Tax=Eumeta variegata TaxID=151549 RepID=A0A4C1YDE9_EUMVA|nr:hypothetical protein EVAR_60607_1 [Eumeta japonica]
MRRSAGVDVRPAHRFNRLDCFAFTIQSVARNLHGLVQTIHIELLTYIICTWKNNIEVQFRCAFNNATYLPMDTSDSFLLKIERLDAAHKNGRQRDMLDKASGQRTMKIDLRTHDDRRPDSGAPPAYGKGHRRPRIVKLEP